MFKLLDSLLILAGYVRADSISAPEPVLHERVQYLCGKYVARPNGKHLFPISTDKAGRPIEFESGVAYVVGSNGRWRKRRVVKAKPEAPGSSVEDGTADDAAQDGLNKVPSRAPELDPRKTRTDRITFDGSLEHRRIYQLWLKIVASCTKPNSPHYKKAGPNGATMDSSWMRYDCFYRDISAMSEHGPYQMLRRINSAKPWGPSNVKYVGLLSEDGRAVTHNRQFTEMQILHIRKSPATLQQLSDQYGVSSAAIHNIKRGKTYREIV